MTTNEIEKQLRAKAMLQIKQKADDIVSELCGFGQRNTNRQNRNCLSWYSKAHKEHAMYDYQDAPSDPWCSYDWNELRQLMTRNLEINYLDQMVEKKAKELLSKIDLLG
tara:strand:+ start:1580 stop:1906 length:327 start_codon:yes stop_codon:yes gene_type:complete